MLGTVSQAQVVDVTENRPTDVRGFLEEGCITDEAMVHVKQLVTKNVTTLVKE